MAVGTSRTEISSINKKDFPKKGNKILKIIDILHEFYGDFDFIKEKWNEDYEGLLIKTKEEQKLAKNIINNQKGVRPIATPNPRVIKFIRKPIIKVILIAQFFNTIFSHEGLG